MSIRSKFFLALLATIHISTTLAAEPSMATKLEVEQLLANLVASGCNFERNGTWYSATEARAHIEKKLQPVADSCRFNHRN
ncbi:MAG: DUF5329 family protein [Herminiimonas sp.]|nr:DUF5329 family protein [Herminiimonas sp.]